MKRMSRKAKLIVVVTALAMVITTGGAFACTGVYIGKNVSKEGTTVIARSEDQGTSNYEKCSRSRSVSPKQADTWWIQEKVKGLG